MFIKNAVKSSLSKKSLRKISVALVIAGALISAYKSRHLLQNKLQNIKARVKNKNTDSGTLTRA